MYCEIPSNPGENVFSFDEMLECYGCRRVICGPCNRAQQELNLFMGQEFCADCFGNKDFLGRRVDEATKWLREAEKKTTALLKGIPRYKPKAMTDEMCDAYEEECRWGERVSILNALGRENFCK